MVIENLQGPRRRQTLVLWTLFYIALQFENTNALGLSRNPLFSGMSNRRNALPSVSIGNHHHNQQLFKHQQNYHQLLHQQQDPLIPAASSSPVLTANNLPNHVDPYISGSNSLDKPAAENPELDQIASNIHAEQKSNNLAASASSTSYTSTASGGYGAGTGGSIGSYGSGGGSYGGGSLSSGGAYGGGSIGAGTGYGGSSTGTVGSYDSAGSIGSYGLSGSYGGSSSGAGSNYEASSGGAGLSYGGSTGVNSYGAGSAGAGSYSSGGGGSSYGLGGSSGSSYGLGGGALSYGAPYGGGSPSYSVSYPVQQGATKADTVHLLSSLAPSLLLSSLLIPLALALLTNTTSSLIGRKKRDVYSDYDDELQLSLNGDILDADITLLDSHFFPTMDAMLESYSPDDGERLTEFVRQRGLLDSHNPCLEKLACLAMTTNSKFKRYDNLKNAIKLLEKTTDPDIKKRLKDGSSVGATKERNCLTKFICKSNKSDVLS